MADLETALESSTTFGTIGEIQTTSFELGDATLSYSSRPPVQIMTSDTMMGLMASLLKISSLRSGVSFPHVQAGLGRIVRHPSFLS